MKWNVLHNFISPVTGYVLADPNYVLVGNNIGAAVPSPILIDIRLDLIDIRANYNILTQASFVIGSPNNQLPNAQVLNTLPDGYMFSTAGIVSTRENILIGELPDLPKGNIWIGDVDNRAAPNEIISIDNLPPLSAVTPLTGEIWRGTISGRPEISDSLNVAEADILLITARFLTAHFVLNNLGLSPPILWPSSQVLSNLGPGIAKIEAVSGLFAIATPDVDYATVEKLEELAKQAQASADAAKASADAARASASTAAGSATAAEVSAGLAAGSAAAALVSAGLAAGSAAEATAAAGEASASAIAATVAAAAAGASAIAAAISAFFASRSASNASDSASAASRSAANAMVSAQNASIYAANAMTSAQNAANSASQAASYLAILLATGLNALPNHGDVNIQGYRIINLGNPVDPQDAVTLFYLESAIGNIPGQIIINLEGAISGSGPSNLPIITTFNETLNQITNAGDVDFSNFRLLNVANPILGNDGVNKNYVDDAISGGIGDITLDGFVVGGPPVDNVITTERGPTCLLTNIPAGGNVSIDNYRVTDLQQSPSGDFDAISTTFLWDLIHDRVDIIWS